MAVVIKIPTWATFARIPSGAPTTPLAALNIALGTALIEGDTNPVWYDLQDLDLGGGPLTRGSNLSDLATVTPIENKAFLTIGHCQLAVSVGGDVEGYPVYFAIADIDTDVPAGWPNREWTDATDEENPVQVVHTWRTWYDGMPGHDPYFSSTDNTYYCSSANTWDRGEPMLASVWAFSGLTIKNQAEFVALRDAENPPE